MTKVAQLEVNQSYKEKYGFSKPDTSVFRTRKGLDEEVVRQISAHKNEPSWMLEFRLKAYEIFKSKKQPTWGADLSTINYDDIYYYIKPTEKKSNTWEDLPAEIRDTYNKIGIPEAEKKLLAGVGAQYDSEVIYHSIKKEWEKKGVIFLDTDSALKKYPEFFKEYFAKAIPPADNKLAALNSAVWSGGSFIYVPSGVKVDIPLQAYFRINAANMGQFERTLIIVDEGAQAHYVEGCFVKGTKITTNPDFKPIEKIKVGDKVLTHSGKYREVYHTQVRPYTGSLYTIGLWGDTTQRLQVTAEHPFLCVKRKLSNERNKVWEPEWVSAEKLHKGDYLAIPINRKEQSSNFLEFKIKEKGREIITKVPSTKEFFRLVGYFLAEGSVERDFYLHFSFGLHEQHLVRDVRRLLKKVFGISKVYLPVHKKNNGVSVVVSSAKLTRIFSHFGSSSSTKRLTQNLLFEDPEKQKELILGLYRGDGNYYNQQNKHGRKEIFRINTTSEVLAKQTREVLLRIGIVASLNKQERDSSRQPIYVVCVGGEFLTQFGDLVGIGVRKKLNGRKRATLFGLDKNYSYVPIRKISKFLVSKVPVYNFSVKDDESYTAGSVAVHNCTAPIYTTDSLHAAVVEIFVKKNARFRYTTIQNWSNNVYNLVTKRAFVDEYAVMEWVDGNIGSKITMKYPSVFLRGRGARGEVLSVAFAGAGQHQDAGGKAIHLAPDTSSQIISKSISKAGGRTSYRGMLKVIKGASGVKANVRCDALILDEKSRSDTYPTMQIDEEDVNIGHEASVSKIGEDQLFYLMSRGMSENEATSMIVNGFIEPIVKELPLEYALELNRLIQLEMVGAVG